MDTTSPKKQLHGGIETQSHLGQRPEYLIGNDPVASKNPVLNHTAQQRVFLREARFEGDRLSMTIARTVDQGSLDLPCTWQTRSLPQQVVELLIRPREEPRTDSIKAPLKIPLAPGTREVHVHWRGERPRLWKLRPAMPIQLNSLSPRALLADLTVLGVTRAQNDLLLEVEVTNRSPAIWLGRRNRVHQTTRGLIFLVATTEPDSTEEIISRIPLPRDLAPGEGSHLVLKLLNYEGRSASVGIFCNGSGWVPLQNGLRTIPTGFLPPISTATAEGGNADPPGQNENHPNARESVGTEEKPLEGRIEVETASFRGASVHGHVTVTNRGSLPWIYQATADNFGAFAVGIRCISIEGRRDSGRIYLNRSLAAGASITLPFSLVLSPGDRELEMEMMVEGVCWFGKSNESVVQLSVPDPPLLNQPLAFLDLRRQGSTLWVKLRVGEATEPTVALKLISQPTTAHDHGPGSTSSEATQLLAWSELDLDKPHTAVGAIRLPHRTSEVRLRVWGHQRVWIARFSRRGIRDSSERHSLAATFKPSVRTDGKSLRGTIDVLNTGGAILLTRGQSLPGRPGGVGVGIQVRRLKSDPWSDAGRVPLTEALHPGQLTRLTVDDPFPRGVRQVALELVAEEVTWFSEIGGQRCEFDLSDLPRSRLGTRPRLPSWPTQWLRSLTEDLGALLDWSLLQMRIRSHREPPHLESHHRLISSGPTGVVNPVDSRDYKPGRPRVLIVTPYHVYPADHGGGSRMLNLIRRTSQELEIHLLVAGLRKPHPKAKKVLGQYCQTVTEMQLPFKNPNRRFPGPPSVQLFGSKEVESAIRILIAEHKIEILQLEYAETAQYARASGSAKVLLIEHDLAFVSLRRRLNLDFPRRFPDSQYFGASQADLRRLFSSERRAVRRADHVVVMSSNDGRILCHGFGIPGEKVTVIPNAADASDLLSLTSRRAQIDRSDSVLFFGNYENLPNLDSLEHFLQEVWPLIRALRPQSRVTVAGARLPETIRAQWHGHCGINCVGFVDNLGETFQEHRVLVVPLRAGSGTRLKVIQAFAAGLPIVATELGVEGLPVAADQHFLVAETPMETARQTIRLLDNPALGDQIASRAAALATDLLDWQASAQVQVDLSKQLAPRSLLCGETSAKLEAVKAPSISVIIPTCRGGETLRSTIAAIREQRSYKSVELLCIDSGSSAEELERLGADYEVIVHSIRPEEFDHGATRDLGASLSTGEILVFLSQDAVPQRQNWLSNLIAPLLESNPPAAVQGGFVSANMPDPDGFFWGTNGPRFHFTRESRRWMQRYWGCGFSTVNAAMSRQAWSQLPLGPFPIMEDKNWQLKASLRGWRITEVPTAQVRHRHDYSSWRRLTQRLREEGRGWRLVGEPYLLRWAFFDACRLDIWRDLVTGLLKGQIRTWLEVSYPWLRPLLLFEAGRCRRPPMGRRPR